MLMLSLGLLIFLGAHSVRIFADDWRAARIARVGLAAWKGGYSLISLAGFALLVWGYGETRVMPELWTPPVWARHLAVTLTLPALVLLAAAYVPGTHIKAAVGHPMLAGVKLWAFAHLLANGRPGDLLLFGAFLAWAVADYLGARRRDRRAGTRYPAASWARDVVAAQIGLLLWAGLAWYGHARLFGVAVLG